jgi:hypothetical protein
VKKDLKTLLKKNKKLQDEAKKYRTMIEDTASYKNCVKWSKEDLAYCKVKYQRLTGKLMLENMELHEEVKELKADIGRITINSGKVINPNS